MGSEDKNRKRSSWSLSIRDQLKTDQKGISGRMEEWKARLSDINNKESIVMN